MEKKLFIFLNLILSAVDILVSITISVVLPILFFLIWLTGQLLKLLSVSYNEDIFAAVGLDFIILTFIVLYFLLIIFKIRIFPFLYKFKEKLPYIHNFFEKFRTESLFRNKVLLFALLSDILFFILSILLNKFRDNMVLGYSDSWIKIFNFELFSFFFFGGGVLTSYASLFIWMFIRKKFKKS